METAKLFQNGSSQITLFEFEYGVEKSQYRQRSKAALAKFLLPLNLINLDRSSAL